MKNEITIWNLSIGTVAVFEDNSQLPESGIFEHEGQRYRIICLLHNTGTVDITKASVLVERDPDL